MSTWELDPLSFQIGECLDKSIITLDQRAQNVQRCAQ